MHLFVVVRSANVERTSTVQDVKNRILFCGIEAGRQPHAQVSSVVKDAAGEWHDVKPAYNRSLARHLLRGGDKRETGNHKSGGATEWTQHTRSLAFSESNPQIEFGYRWMTIEVITTGPLVKACIVGNPETILKVTN
jgi:hypothetical protein